MLPSAPPALLRPADEPPRFQGVVRDFEAWVAQASRKEAPSWNPWKPKAGSSRSDMPGALVVVWGDLPPLETETQEVLRLTVAWIIAHRLDGLAPDDSMAPPLHSTASWQATHPGGNRVPGLVPLGWGRWR